ncbi:hypothetical protein EVAR_84711_1 [Eumeta japonica]|uniref:Uncharacterized protein n=1 Tax=Eumeta variegata TaxID=151549 RepID=A0A4C1VQG1_EUMVA|nr:hypothetical protein EVAR_84711_1 [Eumeta japonica]
MAYFLAGSGGPLQPRGPGLQPNQPIASSSILNLMWEVKTPPAFTLQPGKSISKYPYQLSLKFQRPYSLLGC